MLYAEHAPADALAPILHCLWTFTDEACGAEPQRIVPDGRCELVVHFGAPYREAGAPSPQPRVIFAGQLTHPLWLEATGPAGVIGARFHPASARRFLGLPMDRATDVRMELASLWPDAVAALERAVLEAPTLAARVDAVMRFVGERVVGVRGDDSVEGCVQAMQRGPDAASVEAIARAAGIGRRQLERRFRDHVGVSPGMLADIFRFRRVFDALERDSTRPWTDAALAAGYFDQSHLIRDFHRFVGCTPGDFVAARPSLATALVAT
jgi:AraC-like DNA-binding protein